MTLGPKSSSLGVKVRNVWGGILTAGGTVSQGTKPAWGLTWERPL